MAIGSVLLQPQRIRRSAGRPPADGLVEDLLSLLTRVMMDQARGGRILPIFEEAAEAAAERVAERAEEGVASARDKLGPILESLSATIQSVAESLSQINDVAEGLDAASQVLSLLSGVVENLTVNQLRQYVSLFVDVIENDLGANSDFVEQQVWLLFDDIIRRLAQEPPEADAFLRDNRRTVVAILRRVRRRMQGQFTFPPLSADVIALELLRFLRQSGLQDLAQGVSCYSDAVRESANVASSVARLISPTSSFGPNSVGAAEAAAREEYAWYASWLLGDKDRPWWFFFLPFLPKDEVWKSADGTRMVRKNVCRDDQDLYTGADADWTRIPDFDPDRAPTSPGRRYTFKVASRDFMEDVTFHTDWMVNYTEIILHLFNIPRGRYLSLGLNSAAIGALGTYKLVTRDPDYPFHPALRWLVGRSMATLIGSFQGVHTNVSAANWFLFWFTLVLGDALQSLGNRLLPDSVREAFLSFLTLLNHDEPSSENVTRPDNMNQVDGMMAIFVQICSIILAKIVDRSDYGHPFAGDGDRNVRMWVLWLLLAGAGFGLLAALVGTLVCNLVSLAFDWKLLGKQMLKAVPRVWLLFWPTLYTTKEGDTDDGKYNPQGADFDGYPDQSTSPYLLPYERGKSIMVGQGHQGMWSHNDLGFSQVYAIDFALDQDEEVLCSRDGVVDAFFDQTPDDTTGAWNFVRVRHTTVDNNHDKDAGGNVVTTYAEYGHGRQNSVREIFAARLGIPVATITAANIVGQNVTQGQPIMRAGDTGMSFHNHLHMHVLPDDGTGNPANYTIPFVYRDLTNAFGTDGVPLYGHHYSSENQRVP